MTASERPRASAQQAKFVTGPVLRHILEMTGAGALGLMAIFLGDLANIYFLSLSGDDVVVAAVGYASSILFFSTSIAIGLAIAAASVVAPAIGEGIRARARRRSTHAHLISGFVSAVLGVVLWFAIGPILSAMGADGHTFTLAKDYLSILIPTLPLMALAMTSMSVLRSVGDAKRSMMGTLAGAAVNTVLDAIFILYFGWGILGAALSSLVARFAMAGITFYGVARVHRLISAVKSDRLPDDATMFFAIAVPAVLTNIAQPVGNAVVTAAVAPFGNGAVAGWAVIGRIIPVAFGSIYALSGVVGPIIGQNLGAKRPERMRATLTQSLLVMASFTAVAWLVMIAAADPLARAFNASGQSRDLILDFCRWQSPLFVFLGAVFIANAAFNTLGKPHFSTMLNWARATLGTIPLVMLGAHVDGARGAITGSLLGGVVFGVVSVVLAYRLIERIGHTMRDVK